MTLKRTFFSSLLTVIAFGLFVSCTDTKRTNSEKGNDDDLRSQDNETSYSRPAALGFGIYEIYPSYEIGRDILQILDNTNAKVVREPSALAAIAYAAASDTAAINKAISVAKDSGKLSREINFAWSYHPQNLEPESSEIDCFALYALHDLPAIDASGVPIFTLDRDNFDNKIVTGHLSNDASEIFALVTRNNVGQPLALVIDNNVISCPRITAEIKSGRFQVTCSDDEIEELFDRITMPKSE